MKVSFFKTYLFCKLYFFPWHNVLLPTQLYFVETSRFISCLWYLNVWVKLSAVSLHVVALWKRILKRVFSACGQLLKATYIERNWPPSKRTCKEQTLRLKEQHNRRRPLKSSSKNNTRATMSTQHLNTRTTTHYSPKEKKFLFFSPLNAFFCRKMRNHKHFCGLVFTFTISLRKFRFLCEKSQPEWYMTKDEEK